MHAALVAAARDLVGRSAEVSRLCEAIGQGERLITLVGPAGVGKTRLAFHVAVHEWPRGPRPGAAVICELADTNDVVAACAAVSASLGVSLDASDASEAIARVGAALARRGATLVVLDNLEQLGAEARVMLAQWLAAAPAARFMVTTRHRLHLPGELCVDVPPLSVPEPGDAATTIAGRAAVQLFVARARAARADFDLVDEVARDVAAIVRRVDGLPLAIELCAAHVAMLAPAQLLADLSVFLETPGPASDAAHSRQATVGAALDWSWRLLEPAERNALAQCSLFRGGFDLDAAAAVLDASNVAEARRLLQRLRDRSLLVTYAPVGLGGEVRYRLLEVVREHAARALISSGEAEAAEERHDAYAVGRGAQLLRALDEAPSPSAWTRLFLEVDDLLAVTRRSLARAPGTPAAATRALAALLVLEPAMSARGPLGTLVALLEQALDAAPEELVDPLVSARARLALAIAQMALGRFEQSGLELRRAALAARRAGDTSLEALAEVKLGTARMIVEPGPAADACFERARRLLGDGGDPRVEGILHADLGTQLARAGRDDEALEHRRRAVELLRRSGDLPRVAYALGAVASALLGLGKRREAERCCEEALAIVRAVDNGRVESRVLGTLARVRHERGELDRAREALEQALAIDRTLGARWYQALHLGMLADVELESGRALEAWSLYGRALEELTDVRDPVTAAGLHARLGAAQAMLGRAAEAARHFDDGQEALAEAGASGGDVAATWHVHAGQLDLALARGAAAAGDLESVAEHVDAARARLSHAASGGSEGARALIERSDEARFACRLLEREIAALQTETDTTDAHRQASGGRRVDMLLIGPEAEWFERPGSPRVTLLRRRSARRIFARLVERRMAAPGRALTVPELFEAGWGAERVRRDAMQNRVYVALAKLRQLGLRPLLQSRADGFLIAPDVRVVNVGGGDA